MMKKNNKSISILFAVVLFSAFVSCKTTDMEVHAYEMLEKDLPVESENEVNTEKVIETVSDDDGDVVYVETEREVVNPEVEELKKELEEKNRQLEAYVKKYEMVYDIEPVVIEKEHYVVVDKDDFKEEEKLTGKDAVKKSSRDSIVELKDFTGGMSFFDYDENYQYPVFTKQLSFTTIILNSDENMVDSVPILSDTEHWELTGDVWQSPEGERQLVMVKPKASGLETNMLLVTNKRIYNFILYSTKDDYQPMVRFRYKTEPKFITSKTKHNGPESINMIWEDIDTDNVSFDYKMTVPYSSRNVCWKPELVYDDGSHTYILLPELCLQKEIPAIWEEKNEITNYEFHPKVHNLIIINRLVEKITLKVGKKKIVIQKKKTKVPSAVPSDVNVNNQVN